MATPEDIIEAKRIANVRSMRQPTELQIAQANLDAMKKRLAEYESDPVNAARLSVAEATMALETAQSKTGAAAVKAVAQATKDKAAAERELAAAKAAQAAGVDTTGMSAAQIKTATRTATYQEDIKEAQGTKPTPPPEDEDYTYDYVWRSTVGGRGGNWNLVRFPKFKVTTTSTTSGNGSSSNTNNKWSGDGTKDNPLILNGNPYTGTYNGNTYQNGVLVSKTSDPNASVVTGPTTNVDILKAILRGRGYPADLIDSSVDFLNQLLKEGLEYDNAIEVYLSAKEYTLKNGVKISSPFYAKYGKFNEGLAEPYDAGTLFNLVEGFKGVVQKYGLNSKFSTDDSISKYLKNKVKVAELDERANAARLRAVTADPLYVESLRQLGYINKSADLTDFFLDPEIGTKVLEQNRRTTAFSVEALRRAGAVTGIRFNTDFIKQMGAYYTAQGLSEAEITDVARTGYVNIAEQLMPTTKLAGIYQKAPASDVEGIQKELEAEQFLGMASQRRKTLAELEKYSFLAGAGTSKVSLKRPTGGLI